MSSRNITVVVGLGPAGVIVSRVLAAAGRSVLAFQPLPADGSRAALAAPRPTVRRSSAQTAVLAAARPRGADRLGGSKHLAAPQSYRLDDGAFASWPITPADLSPFYRRVERAFRVGPRPGTPWTRRMERAATALGHRPFAAPAAASADVSPLLDHPGIAVTDATVRRILLDAAGAVRGVEYVGDDGSIRTVPCETVVVAGGVIASIRLLLLSGITGSGLVGRGVMAHNAFTVHGLFPGEDLGRDQAGPATAVAVSDFEGGRFRAEGFRGGSILQAAMTGARDDAWRDALARESPGGTASWIRAHERSIGTVWAQPDQFPRDANAVDLDPTHRDAGGDPVARITFDLADDDLARWRYLRARMVQWLSAAGAQETWGSRIEPQPLGTHLYGGIPMGRSPRSSVVDAFGRAHDVPGLVVAGSSTFPSTGGRGPVETIEALAWRTATALAR